jgi:hypothetical protein
MPTLVFFFVQGLSLASTPSSLSSATTTLLSVSPSYAVAKLSTDYYENGACVKQRWVRIQDPVSSDSGLIDCGLDIEVAAIFARYLGASGDLSVSNPYSPILDVVVATPRFADGTFQEDSLGIVLSQDFSDASPGALQFGVLVLCIGTFLHLTPADVHFATQTPVAALLPPTAGIGAAVSSTSLVVVPKTNKAMRALPEPLRQSWFAAVFTEYGNLERLEIFDPLRHLPDGKKALRTKHVNRVKYDKDGNVEKFNVRVCVEGQLMEHRTDY